MFKKFVCALAAMLFALTISVAAQTANSPPESCEQQHDRAQAKIRAQQFNLDTLAFLLKSEREQNRARTLSIEEFHELLELRREVAELQLARTTDAAEIQAQRRILAWLLDQKKPKGKSRLDAIVDWLLKRL